MFQVKSFVFNPFSENTYVVSNENGDCIIFDPGMYTAGDQMLLQHYIADQGLKPGYLINTHCHIDHIFGNRWCAETYQLPLHTHRLEQEVLNAGAGTALIYGLHYNESVKAEVFLSENECIRLGNDELQILFTPGHSPGSLSFYSPADGFVIAGDVLFRESVGRSDLPGGNHETLIRSIREKLLTLPDDTVVYSGHGPATTIGHERRHNPFLIG